jgi:hypothetical protein
MTIFSHFLRLPNLEGQIPVIISPRNMVAHLYPQALGQIFEKHRIRVTLRLTVSQYVLVSSPLCGRLTRHCFLFKMLGLLLPNAIYICKSSPYFAGNILCSATKPNRIMLFGNSRCLLQNHKEHTDTVRTSQEIRLRYSAQPDNAVWGNSRCLL